MLGEGSLSDYAVASLDRSVTTTVIVGTLPALNGQGIGFTIIAGVANDTLFLNGSDTPNIYRVALSPGVLPDLNGQEFSAAVTATIEPARLVLTGKDITFITPLHGGNGRKPKNYRTGLEPVTRRPPQTITVKKKPTPIPPYRTGRKVTAEPNLPLAVSLETDLTGLQDEIFVAQDLLEQNDLEEILSLQDGEVGEILMLLDID